MKSFPMFFRTSGRHVVIVGGGEQAAQKARLILKSDAEIRLVADELDAELRGLVAAGRAVHLGGDATPQTFAEAAITFVATGCAGADGAYHALAKAAGAVVNVVDRPDLCDVITPSIVDRDPVVVAIGTEGTAPVLGRAIKTQVETMLPPRVGALAALAGRLRGAVAENLPEKKRRAFWAWVFKGRPAQLHAGGAEDEAATLIKAAIEAREVPEDRSEGHIALVGAGPGAKDLLTLRAVERLQEADVIFYDRLSGDDALELARRDAERVYVGKEVGAAAWPQDRISALIVSEARKGRRVVRLKAGDPAIFGRATEELAAAEAAGVPVEIVPGVTAASAAAATLGTSLSVRGESDTVVLTTGTCRDGDALPDWAHHARAGTTLAVYMGVGAAASISAQLLKAGVPGETAVDIVADASHESERVVITTVRDLAATLERHKIKSRAMLMIRFRKAAAVETRRVA